MTVSPPCVGVAYCITNLINGKRYIGITRFPKKRWQGHLNDSRASPRLLYAAMRKYGVDNFSFDVIACSKSTADLQLLEQSLIEQYDSNKRKLGYNRTTGGEGSPGLEHGPETRAKMSAARLGKPRPDVSMALRGKPRPDYVMEGAKAVNYGHPRDPEMRAKVSSKLSAAGRGKSPTEETRQKLRESAKQNAAKTAEKNRGRKRGPRSPEHCRKLSDSLKGRRPADACYAGQKARMARLRESGGRQLQLNIGVGQ